jgi:signal peptidase I
MENFMKKEIIEWTKAFVLAIIVVFVINVFITPTTVFSISMNPTLYEGDVLILQKSNHFEHGDIVSFKSDLALSSGDLDKLNPIQRLVAKRDPYKNLIKRVIGLPGDSIFIENEEVYINGIKQEEAYIGSPTIGSVYIEKIPENHYFLMGDNRSHSTDSRESIIGVVAGDKIIGKSLVRVFPLSKLGKVD